MNRGFIQLYRTCETAEDVAKMQEQIITELEADYDEQRREGETFIPILKRPFSISI
jgi:hypothetical protein